MSHYGICEDELKIIPALCWLFLGLGKHIKQLRCMTSVNYLKITLNIAIFAFKKLLQFSWKYENYEYEIKAYDYL